MNPFENIYVNVCVRLCINFSVLFEMTKANQRCLLACFLIIKYVSIQFTVSSEAAGQNEKPPKLFTMSSNLWLSDFSLFCAELCPHEALTNDHAPKY